MNVNCPLVSIYITNYNYGQFIEEAISSVLNQTYPNIEILIIDDGSTDQSKVVIESYIKHEKINVIFQKNKGLTKTNNVALRLAQGRYIVRLDADDKFKPDAIENLVSGFITDDVAMVFGDWEVVDEDGNFLYHFQRHDFDEDVTLYDCPAHGACTMFRTDYLKAVGGYDEELLCQDGYELWFRIVDKFKVKNLKNIVFEYRRHGKNLTGNEDRILSTRSNILKKISEKKGYNSKPFAFIPVRGSTLDARSMPFEKIGGRFLIDIVLEGVIGFDIFDKVVVSTPDANLIDYITEKYKEKVLIDRRNYSASLINKKLDVVVCDFMDKTPSLNGFSHGVVFGVERPFNKKYLVESAIDVSQIFNLDNVVGVRPNDDVLFTHNGSTLRGINFDRSGLRLERDELYQMVKGFLVFKLENLSKYQSLWGNVIGHVVFDQKCSHSISSELDKKIAELISLES